MNTYYKVIVLGNDRSGKTRFCTSALGNNCTIHELRGYTEGVNTYTKRTDTAEIELWDTGRGGLRGGYFIGTDAAVILSTNDNDTRKYVIELSRHAPDARFVVVNPTQEYDANQILRTFNF